MVTKSFRTRSIWAAFIIAGAVAAIGGCGKQEDAPASATKGAATPPAAVTVATIPAATGKLACTAFAVESAKDARGAPLWQTSGDVAGNASKAAPSHVAVGRTVLAACQTELGKHGYGICVRDPSGQWGG